MRREHTKVVRVVSCFSRHHLDALAFCEPAVHHAHQHHHTDVGVKPTVDDHRAQRACRIASRCRHFGHNGLKDFVDAHAGLSRTGDGVGRINANHVFDF